MTSLVLSAPGHPSGADPRSALKNGFRATMPVTHRS